MTEDERITNALREWLGYETWTLREGLLILAGIDPHHAECFEFNQDCTSFQASAPEGVRVGGPQWCRIGSPPRIEVDAEGVANIAGWLFSPSDAIRLCELVEHWHRTPSHDGMRRISPAHFISWSERIDKAPFWLNAVRRTGYLPASTSAPAGNQSDPTPAPEIPDGHPWKVGRLWTEEAKAEMRRQREDGWKDGRIAEHWGFERQNVAGLIGSRAANKAKANTPKR